MGRFAKILILKYDWNIEKIPMSAASMVWKMIVAYFRFYLEYLLKNYLGVKVKG